MMNANESKPVTVRVPDEWLTTIEEIAKVKYPSRKSDGGNRSQVVLDAIEFYLKHRSDDNVHAVNQTQNIVTKDELDSAIASLRDELQPILDAQKEVESKWGKLIA